MHSSIIDRFPKLVSISRLPKVGKLPKGVACAWSAVAAACILGASAQPAIVACAAEIAPEPVVVVSYDQSAEEQFFAQYAKDATESQKSTGVPASVTLAQAALESDWGRSGLTRDAKNFFGIKTHGKPGTAGSITLPTWEVIRGANVTVQAAFRAYESARDSFIDHGYFFIENPRYAQALAVKHDARAFAHAIANAGYATDPAYATKLIRLMDRFDLYRFDLPQGGGIELAKATVVQEPVTVQAPAAAAPGPEKLFQAAVLGSSKPEAACGVRVD